VLADVVGTHPRRRGEAGDRRRVDDVSFAALREHPRDEAADAVDHAPEVHPEDPLPVGERVLPDVLRDRDAGVVAHQVHGAVRVERPLRERLDVGGPGDVGHDREDGRSAGLHLRLDARQRSGLDVGEDDLHPFRGERAGHGASDAARRAGHHGNLLVQVFHVLSSLLVGGRIRSGRILRSACGPPTLRRNGASSPRLTVFGGDRYESPTMSLERRDAAAGRPGQEPAEPLELFVPGRLCLLGEHSDWAGEYRSLDSSLTPGRCLVTGTDQGLWATAGAADELVISSVLPDGSREGPRRFVLEEGALDRAAKERGFFSYAAGVAAEVSARFASGGLRLAITRADLPLGKGLSSSAAVCVLVARAFNRVTAT